jgi:pimeloyl-ACP methyl ester carboxylesterase
MAGVSSSVREQALLLGRQQSLVGVLAPGNPQPDRIERPYVVMLNAGIIHRVGPNRLHVELARLLAAQGFSSLRFDLSGIGDSEKRTDGLTLLEASLADVREVLDWLEASRGAGSFILLGLCSGADHALLHAGSDPRVAGVVLLDPSIPRTRGYYLRHYGRRLLKASSWWNFAGALPRLVSRSASSLTSLRSLTWLAWLGPLKSRQAGLTNDVEIGAGDGEEPLDEAWADRPEARAFLKLAYQKAIDQGSEMLAIVTGDLENRQNYREQLLDAMQGVSFGDRLRLERFGDSDHTFSFEGDRRRVLSMIVDWVRTRPCSNALPAERQKVRDGELVQS